MFRTLLAGFALAALTVATLPTTATAQDVMTKESVATLRTAFLADLATMHDKFLGLAQAFPPDKYTWRQIGRAHV